MWWQQCPAGPAAAGRSRGSDDMSSAAGMAAPLWPTASELLQEMNFLCCHVITFVLLTVPQMLELSPRRGKLSYCGERKKINMVREDRGQMGFISH
ncbi:hypothetical protein AOLI_G00323060 [Acnodon oligacanthus]